MSQIEHLNLSNNHLNSKSVTEFLRLIDNKNKLKLLDLSFNTLNQNYCYTDKNMRSYSFESVFAKFLKKSTTLLHLDLSGTKMQTDNLCEITEKGLRKNRSLISIHLSRLGIVDEYEMKCFRDLLRVK